MKSKDINKLLEKAYLLGFQASTEGRNGEFPYEGNKESPEDDKVWINNRDKDLSNIKLK